MAHPAIEHGEFTSGRPAACVTGRISRAVTLREASALGLAALVATCLLATTGEEPLPATTLAAAFLFLAVHEDVRGMRIPNWLTFPSLAGALALGAASGWADLQTALAGAGAALAVLFVPFAARWIGAGDVKAGMVLGALWGADLFLPALWWMLVFGGALALALVTLRGGLADLAGRWARTLQLSLLGRKWTYFAPAAGSPAASGLPFAVAMGLGAVAYQTWGTPWFS